MVSLENWLKLMIYQRRDIPKLNVGEIVSLRTLLL